MLQESNRVELKEKLNEKLEREICAFLNNRIMKSAGLPLMISLQARLNCSRPTASITMWLTFLPTRTAFPSKSPSMRAGIRSISLRTRNMAIVRSSRRRTAFWISSRSRTSPAPRSRARSALTALLSGACRCVRRSSTPSFTTITRARSRPCLRSFRTGSRSHRTAASSTGRARRTFSALRACRATASSCAYSRMWAWWSSSAPA